jgi:hypothetical protein
MIVSDGGLDAVARSWPQKGGLEHGRGFAGGRATAGQAWPPSATDFEEVSMAGMNERPTTRFSMAAGAALVATLVAAPAVAADRLTDRDIARLFERIDDERDRFEDQLDGDLKDSILRGPGLEVDVEHYLDDLQGNVDRLRERFSGQYAASAEVTTVLRQGSDIQWFMSTQPANLDGASEWNRLASSLSQLAAAYATVFPLPAGHQARRMNDREVREAADEIEKNADRFKKDLDSSLKRDRTIDQVSREASVRNADLLKQHAARLESTIGDGRPASGEAQALLQHAAAVRVLASGPSLSPAARAGWELIEAGLDKVALAFGLPARP